MHNYKIF